MSLSLPLISKLKHFEKSDNKNKESVGLEHEGKTDTTSVLYMLPCTTCLLSNEKALYNTV
jgi:hypothetical protein